MLPTPKLILDLLQNVSGAAKFVCSVIDEADGLDREERHALRDLRQAIESLKFDTMLHKVLINAMQNDTNLDGSSPFAIFIAQYVWSPCATAYTPTANYLQYDRQAGHEAMKSFETALKATQLMLEENQAGTRHEATTNHTGSKKPRRALDLVLHVLNANLRPAQRQELIRNLQDSTKETNVCQENNERAFKLVWNLYVISQQKITRRSSVDNVSDIQGLVGQALDSVLHSFHTHPFAVSPEGDSQVNLLTFAALNHNHETATKYEDLARRIGTAWVADRVSYNVQVRDLAALQTSLFELLWSGTIEQLKKRGADTADDPERPEFEKALVELEKGLQEAIVRSKKQRFAIAFCGMVKAGKSLFLNALMGRAILPSDGEPDGFVTPVYYSEHLCRAPFYGVAVPASSR